LEIGEFIEQREPPRLDDDESLNSKSIQDEMRNYFEKVEEDSVVHITVLRASKPIK
jgi:hypothetical protein